MDSDIQNALYTEIRTLSNTCQVFLAWFSQQTTNGFESFKSRFTDNRASASHTLQTS